MKPAITVQPVSRRSERREFIALPHRLYSGDPRWVAPLFADIKEKLDPARHPFYRNGEVELYLARRGRKAVGRIAALVNHNHNEFHGERAAGFGLFEVERDEEAAAALIGAAARWAQGKGMTVLHGPLNFSTNEECGTLIEGFDHSPTIMMPYNPPWHVELLEAAGLRKAKELLGYTIDDTADFSRMKRLSDRLLERGGISIRPMDRKDLEGEIERAREIYNSAWEKNWGFVPMTDAEFRWQAQKLKPVLVPELALFAEAEGKLAAFSLSLPDLNQALAHINGRLFPFGLLKFLWHRRKVDTIRVITMGVRKEFRGVGLEGLLINRTIENGKALHYRRAELSWILEDNEAVRRIVEKMGAILYKRYALWEGGVEELLQ
jgi:GNAT superfamily N-acetyltransferase